MERETADVLRAIADVLKENLKENDCEYLINEIARRDYKAGQVISMFVYDRLK